MFITVHISDTIKQGTVRVFVPRTVQVSQIETYFPADHGGARLCFVGGEGILNVRETPAEIMALVAAEQRKRDRLMLAGQFMASDLARGDVCSPITYVKAADDLLAALDKEGE